jgi:ribonuclease T2
MRRLMVVVLGVAAMLCAPNAFAAGRDLGPGPPGKFDYYVLTLSWVPGFCRQQPSSSECSKGLGFALHGLWPQFEGGNWPSNCKGQALTARERQQYSVVYPDPTMITHEWKKHGECSGLSPADYYALSTADENEVVIPDAYKSPQTLQAQDADAVRLAFLTANPSLPPDGINVAVSQGVVLQVEFCLTKQGAFRSCAA